VVPPLKFDIGTNARFDPVALFDSTLVVTAVVLLCWTLLYVLKLRKTGILLAFIATSATWAVLISLFFTAESDFGRGVFSEGFLNRATAVMANGADMAFMPLVIPLLSLMSGAGYSAELGLCALPTRSASEPA